MQPVEHLELSRIMEKARTQGYILAGQNLWLRSVWGAFPIFSELFVHVDGLPESVKFVGLYSDGVFMSVDGKILFDARKYDS
jgi:hypothetical protein